MFYRYQGGYPHTPLATPHPTTEADSAPAPPAPAPVVEEAVPLNQPVQNQRPAPDAPIRMNAGPGAPMDDDDEVNRDWLDWGFTICRFLVFVSIVYFYSTLGRFVLVFGFFFVVYL